jgi:DNA-binding PadR family transcriptional regulator
MKYSSYIDNVTAKEWGLTIQLAYLFDWIYSLPSWAQSARVGDATYYFASRNLVSKELPMISDKPDTIYRYYKDLEKMGLINTIKFGTKDYISLTKKAKKWGRKIEKIDGIESECPEDDSKNDDSNSENTTEKIPIEQTTIPYQIIKIQPLGEGEVFSGSVVAIDSTDSVIDDSCPFVQTAPPEIEKSAPPQNAKLAPSKKRELRDMQHAGHFWNSHLTDFPKSHRHHRWMNHCDGDSQEWFFRTAVMPNRDLTEKTIRSRLEGFLDTKMGQYEKQMYQNKLS